MCHLVLVHETLKQVCTPLCSAPPASLPRWAWSTCQNDSSYCQPSGCFHSCRYSATRGRFSFKVKLETFFKKKQIKWFDLTGWPLPVQSSFIQISPWHRKVSNKNRAKTLDEILLYASCCCHQYIHLKTKWAKKNNIWYELVERRVVAWCCASAPSCAPPGSGCSPWPRC